MGETGETRYEPLVDSDTRTGRELVTAWEGMVLEAREGLDYVGRQLEEGPFSVPGLGWGRGVLLELPGNDWSGPGRS